jgi:sortase A
VFRGLHDIEIGDQVIVSTDTASYTYVVQEIHMRLFTTASLEEQLSVGAFIGPMPEERLTLVTCWPYQIDTHRLIVVAKPV